MIDFLGISEAFIWLILIIIFVIAEIITARFVALSFALGALCSLVASYINKPLIIQAAVFIIASAISSVICSFIYKNLQKTKKRKP